MRGVPRRRGRLERGRARAPVYACHSTTPGSRGCAAAASAAAQSERARFHSRTSVAPSNRWIARGSSQTWTVSPGRGARAGIGAHRERAGRRLDVQHDLGAEHLAHRDLAGQRDVAAALLERQPLGANADDDRDRAPTAPGAAPARARAGSRSPGRARLLLAGLREVGGEEVHRRRAEEAGDEPVRRPLVDLDRRADLLDDAVLEHDDLIGERHRFDLIVGDVHRGRVRLAVDARDLAPHVAAQLRVEVRQRLVEQEHLGLAHDRATDRDALALAARQRLGPALEVRRRGRGSRRPRRRAAGSRPRRRCLMRSPNAMFSNTVMCG